ncbi:MAG: TIGR03936 family radical SAM-associated protein [Oscillospiraceae bacterium]|jgi:radical SAM-linked protein|nr:TIGR03936 family radical SAM-associated protein [Oscillospiraceae bacterium]
MMNLNIRLAYRKTGRARFLSHLDTMRVFARALTRAGLPLRYTEGFNPHIVLSIALPLGVGMESAAERLDFGVMQNIGMGTLPSKLNAVLPEGFFVTQAVIGGRPISQIAFARVEITADSPVSTERVTGLFTSSAVVEKRNKKKELVPTDIVPFIKDIACEAHGDKLRVTATLTARDPVLNPEYLAEAWRTYLDPEAAFSFKRLALLDEDGKSFDTLM